MVDIFELHKDEKDEEEQPEVARFSSSKELTELGA
jgi:hypothetical protein